MQMNIIFMILFMTCFASFASASKICFNSTKITNVKRMIRENNNIIIISKTKTSMCVTSNISPKSTVLSGDCTYGLNQCYDCSTFCDDQGYFTYCCDGYNCCCYKDEGPCDRVKECAVTYCNQSDF